MLRRTHIHENDTSFSDELGLHEGLSKDRRGWKSRLRRMKQVFDNKLVMAVTYLISFLIMYEYFKLKGEIASERSHDELRRDWANDQTSRPDESPEVYERFRYKSDAVLLPLAPYKHVANTLDTRATVLIYLDAIRQQITRSKGKSDNTPPLFDFHWSDWVDMSDLQPLITEKPSCFVAGVLGSNIRTEWNDCIDVPPKKQQQNGLHFYFDRPATTPESEFRLLLRAKTYLYSVAPLPRKLIFVVGELAFVTKTKLALALRDNHMTDEYIASRLKDHKDISLTGQKIVEQPVTAESVVEMISDELNRDVRDFVTPPSQYADVSSANFKSLLKKIKKSKQLSQAARSGKHHFHNSLIRGDNNDFEALYDWRFFQKNLDQQRHRAALHHTVRLWLAMSNNLGIVSWLDEDHLVGWAFNGLALPWEKTIKFKLASKDFQRLGTYNYSLVIDDPVDNNGIFLLDVSPYYMERARLNDATKSPDLVDARFIDIKTGVYIELNGLMVSEAELPADIAEEFKGKPRSEFVNSGDGKFYHQSDILPVKRTLFEGKLANVPGNSLKLILHSNNQVFNDKEFDSYRYQEHLRLWISKSKCNYVPQEDIDIYEKGGSTFIGACHDMDIWAEFNRTEPVTSFRQKEIASKEQPSIGARDQYPALYPDYWLLDRVEKLNKEYGYALPGVERLREDL